MTIQPAREIPKHTYMAYFTLDGNYGEAHQLVVVDTAPWTDHDWAEIEEALDWERPALAEKIAKRYQSMTNSPSKA